MQEERRKDEGGALGICLTVLVVLRGEERGRGRRSLRQRRDKTPRALVPVKV
jgi:hypothetical protein